MKSAGRLLASGLMASLAIAGVSVAITAITPPTAAVAAAGVVEVSDDGWTFGAAYPGALFDDVALLVPGDSQQQVFYVRNSGTEAGFLRVTLRDVAFTNTDFADALTVTARTAGQPGSPASLLTANPCWVLLEGPTVAPGEVVRVTAGLSLAQLHGMAGQGASAALAIGVELSDTSAGSLPPTACGSPSTQIPAVPGRPGSATSGSQAQSGIGSGDSAPAGDGDSQPGAGAEAGGDLPVLNLPGGIVIDPNTWHLYEELLVLVLVAATMLGSGWFMMVAWLRRRRIDEEGEVIA